MLSDVAAPALSSLRVLVANSNAHSRSLVRIALRTLGVRDGIEASDAAAALRLATGGHVDAALIEQDSLGLDGASLARDVRPTAGASASRLPIVMVAAQASSASVGAARDAGVNAFLLRPISAALVKARLVAAITDQRPFVVAQMYVGPDRRFRAVAQGFPPRRIGDDTPAGEADPPGAMTGTQTI